MKYYAVFSEAHGLKTVQAGSERLAAEFWRQNAGGACPDWCAWYPVKLHANVNQIRKIGWTGSAADFAAALGGV